jgi:hypothetical protein
MPSTGPPTPMNPAPSESSQSVDVRSAKNWGRSRFCAEERYILLVDFFNISSTSGVDFVKISYCICVSVSTVSCCICVSVSTDGWFAPPMSRSAHYLCLIRVSTKNIISSTKNIISVICAVVVKLTD